MKKRRQVQVMSQVMVVRRQRLVWKGAATVMMVTRHGSASGSYE